MPAEAGKAVAIAAPTVSVVVENGALAGRIEAALTEDGLSLVEQEGCEVVIVATQREVLVQLQALRDRTEAPIVVVGNSGGRLAACVRRGLADAVVAAPELERALAPTVRAVVAGQVALPRSHRHHLGRAVLSRRERDVMRLVVEGQTNDQIAAALFLTTSTVKSHLTSAFAKLGVSSRAEASALLLDPDEPIGRTVLDHSGRFER